jgi:hypothetical protein
MPKRYLPGGGAMDGGHGRMLELAAAYRAGR